MASIKPSPMGGWNFSNQKSKALDENDLVLGVMLSQRSNGIELLQNCDLPPPIRVFSGSDSAVLASMNKIYSLTSRKVEEDELGTSRNFGTEKEKLEILKALRLSQTRAREAETRYAAIAKERDSLSHAFLNESMQVFAYRQLVKLLELQVSKLQLHIQQRQPWLCSDCCGPNGVEGGEVAAADGGEDGSGLTWIMTMAFCFGIAGLGFAFAFAFG
ncbi:hypothetical protein Nepgr_007761 [Nepenthes gracilis]|uniref:Uncharacterized protein n=1 Tax=Nepenthes gracilis TaxID=150966 RepID=A0AAD3S7W1_NEPGR|nr:hypothetical protein Nepgr_007761 [Nepenthes gracilis]